MPMSERLLSGHRVVSIDQSGDFFQRRARRHLDRMNYVDALGCLRRAVRIEPDNQTYWLDMAETFTEMNCYDESNNILFYLIQSNGGNECFFGMGCNFLGLQEFEKARESFLTYIRLEPDGIYREDVEDLLDALEEQMESPPPAATSPRVHLLALRGKHALDQGDAARAKHLLERALDHDPKLHHARNNLSLALFCLKEYPSAIAQAQMVLDMDPDNLYAHCALALALDQSGDQLLCDKTVQRALELCGEQPHDLSRVCVMLHELGRHELALKKLSELRPLRPYDLRTLHALAAAHAHCGQWHAARKVWAQMSAIDPENTISAFYLAQADAVLAALDEGERDEPPAPSTEDCGPLVEDIESLLARSGAPTAAAGAEPHLTLLIGGGQIAAPPEIPYAFQVPHAEAIRRFQLINRQVADGLEVLRERWTNDDALRALLLWGLTASDASIKRALLALIASFKDGESERVLRMFLGRRDEPDSVKREVFGMLKQMGAEEPYIAFMDDAIVEVRVNLLGDPLRLPSEYEAVLTRASSRMKDLYEVDPQRDLVHIWAAYLRKNEGRLPRISRPDGWAAALEYVFCVEHGIDVPITELCRRHHTSPRTLRMIALRLFDALDTHPLPEEGTR